MPKLRFHAMLVAGLAAAALALPVTAAQSGPTNPCPTAGSTDKWDYSTKKTYAQMTAATADLAAPGDSQLQLKADCFSWQTFLALATSTPAWEGSSFVNKFALPGQTATTCSAQPSKIPKSAEGGGEATGNILYTPDGSQRVWYEVFVNSIEAGYLKKTPPPPPPLPSIALPNQSMELKLAWLPTAAIGSDTSGYYTTTIDVPDSSGSCKSVEVALVGIHILHWTENYKGWIWSSFEHENNAPNKANCGSSSAKCATKTGTPAKYPTWLFFDAGTTTKASPNYTNGYATISGEEVTQVIRMLDISSNANLNSWWQSQAGSPWSHYVLVGTQLATGTADTSPVAGVWPTLSNTVLETTIQSGTSGAANLSCVQCHSGANCNQSFVAAAVASSKNPPFKCP